MEQLPAYVHELFWEEMHEDPDPDRHPDYIAIRVLESGGELAYRWLVERMGRERIRDVIGSGRLRPTTSVSGETSFSMHDECVAPDAADLAHALADTAARHELALGGGTACALRLGHRVSRDLDFFALRPLDSTALLGELVGFDDQRLRGMSHSELVVVLNGVQVSATSLGRDPLALAESWRELAVLSALDLAELKVRRQFAEACCATSATSTFSASPARTSKLRSARVRSTSSQRSRRSRTRSASTASQSSSSGVRGVPRTRSPTSPPRHGGFWADASIVPITGLLHGGTPQRERAADSAATRLALPSSAAG